MSTLVEQVVLMHENKLLVEKELSPDDPQYKAAEKKIEKLFPDLTIQVRRTDKKMWHKMVLQYIKNF